MSEENLQKVEETAETENFSESENEETSSAESDETEASPRRKFFVILGIVALVLLLIGVYFYLERNKTTAEPTAETKEETVVSVKVATAEKQPIAQDYTGIGTVAPAEQSTVAASISAQIKQMRLLKNQSV
ncbi:MAG: hypothetical protein ABJA66_21475, partial [Actinomycetota bacterium]